MLSKEIYPLFSLDQSFSEWADDSLGDEFKGQGDYKGENNTKGAKMLNH